MQPNKHRRNGGGCLEQRGTDFQDSSRVCFVFHRQSVEKLTYYPLLTTEVVHGGLISRIEFG